MNKVGIQIGFFIRDWQDDQFPYIAKAAELGFDVLELGIDYIRSFDDELAEKVKNEAERYSITLLCSGGLSPDNDIGSPFEKNRKKGIEFLSQAAIKMNKADIRMCNGLTHGAWNGNANLTNYAEKAIYRKNSIASLKELSKIYADNNVIFNVEVVNRFENFLLNTAKEARKFVEEVDSKNIGIHLDTFHMNIEENSFEEAIHIAGDMLNFFHVGENNRKMPGLGMLPWNTIFEALKDINYTGIISMEPFVDPEGSVGRSVSLFRPLIDKKDSEQLIRNSVTFIHDML